MTLAQTVDCTIDKRFVPIGFFFSGQSGTKCSLQHPGHDAFLWNHSIRSCDCDYRRDDHCGSTYEIEQGHRYHNQGSTNNRGGHAESRQYDPSPQGFQQQKGVAEHLPTR